MRHQKTKKEKAEDLQSSIRLPIRDTDTHEIEKGKTEVNSFLSQSHTYWRNFVI